MADGHQLGPLITAGRAVCFKNVFICQAADRRRDWHELKLPSQEEMMNKFGSTTVATMRAVLEEVCVHIPRNSTSVRAFIASQILKCASAGEESYDGLLTAARRAVIDQFGNIDAVRRSFR
jgi:hypothetical protein